LRKEKKREMRKIQIGGGEGGRRRERKRKCIYLLRSLSRLDV
jgi:hypothetical protein